MKKKVLLCFLFLSLTLSACSGGSKETSAPQSSGEVTTAQSKEEETTVEASIMACEFEGVTYNIPGNWTEKNSTDTNKYYYAENGFLMVSFNEGILANIIDYSDEFIDGLKQDTDYMNITQKGTILINSQESIRVVADMGISDRNVECEIVAFSTDSGIASFSMLTYKDTDSEVGYKDAFDKVVKSISFNPYVPEEESSQETETPTTEAQASAEVTEAQDTPEITIGQKNALSSANRYLNVMAFSYTGLIEQLEYEGYSNEEATYAADNCGADWNEQAAQMAQSYLDTMSFSRQGLIDQLVYEGFTAEQAEYGVTAVGY